jgi:exopolysaccharide biosynthesis protein
MLIPDTSFAVLSCESSTNDFTKFIHIGDTIKIFNSISPANPRIKEAIGGFIQTVKDGKVYVDPSYIKEKRPQHALQRHPRTAIGFSQDSTKLFLITVDGRQKQSVGMTLHELADLMIKLGVSYGLNLDGGGSTTMVVNDSIVNNPSGEIERAVGNGLLIIYRE